MNPNYPKISVIIITYNQENIINRAIDSVLNQKDYLHEIIISDDCSQDGTWEVVKKYKEKYPEKLKSQRHNQNLGIYENLESTYNLVTGNLIFYLSGDDAMGESLLKNTCELFSKNPINYDTDKFCVITDFKIVYPDNSEKIIRNDLVQQYNPFSLKFRNLIFNRALGESRAIFDLRKSFSIKRSNQENIPTFLQEMFFDSFPFYYCNKIYYLSIVGNIYYSNLGISSLISTKFRKKRLLSEINYINEIKKYFKNLNNEDLNWLKYTNAKIKYLLKPSFKNYYNYFKSFLLIRKDPLKSLIYKKEIKIFIKSVKFLINESN